MAEPAKENQEDHRASPEAVLAEDMTLVGVAAAAGTAVALLDNLAYVEEDMVPVSGFPIAVEEHCMPRLSEAAVVVAWLREELSKFLELLRV